MVSGVEHRIKTKPHSAVGETRVSVVVPVYNYGLYLESCIRSVLSQEGVDIELLVLDDSSSDDSLLIARRFAEEDSRIRVIAHKTNRGHIPTVNEGMAEVSGEFVVKLDADDMLTAESLKRSVALLQAFPSVGFVYGLPWVIGAGNAPPVSSGTRSWTIWPGREWLRKRTKMATNCIMQPEAIIRLSALRETGPYREKLLHTSDFEMWMRLAARYDVGRLNGAYQGFKREHSTSMSRTVNGGLLFDITERVRAIDSLFSEYSAVLPDAKQMSDEAHHTLAREALGHVISAYARGVADQEPVEDYIALALSVWTNADRLRDWRVVSRLRGSKQIPLLLHPSLTVREALRDLKYRLRWYQWKWSGV
jgi:glycosyltransferase involved in cell wall biosynthesis